MPYCVYIALAGEEKLSIWTMDARTGRLRLQGDVAAGGAPGPLAVDPGRRFMYVGLRSTCQLASFRICADSGSLSFIGTVSLDADPCYMSTDRTGSFVLSAYYRAGAVSVHRVGPDGAALSPSVQWVVTADKAHSIQTDASNRYAFVPHVAGSNLILQFLFDERTGHLAPNAVPRVVPDTAAGPRHYCFHPNGSWVYFCNEQGCSVTAYRFDASAGSLVPVQTVSTLPAHFDGQNTCAQIHMTSSGRFLYAANRGHGSIACFSIDPLTGRMTAVGQHPTEKTPRAFSLDHDGRYLYVAGLDSGRLCAYRICPDSGLLDLVETYAVGQRPMWVHVLELRGR
jgi:6-phosphogluconolactonase (cycloisomerase 2 family)